jgi:hypothetical protein
VKKCCASAVKAGGCGKSTIDDLTNFHSYSLTPDQKKASGKPDDGHRGHNGGDRG